MGYTVTVVSRQGLRRERAVFSENISHRAMRHALDSLLEVYTEGAPDRTPWRLLGALMPGENGATLDRRACAAEVQALYMATHAAEAAGDPNSWVIRVLWEAMAYADDYRGTVHFE